MSKSNWKEAIARSGNKYLKAFVSGNNPKTPQGLVNMLQQRRQALSGHGDTVHGSSVNMVSWPDSKALPNAEEIRVIDEALRQLPSLLD